MSPEELVIFVSTISIAIAKDKSDEELGVIAAIFTQLGDTLATMIAQRERCEIVNKNNTNVNNNSSMYNSVE